MATNANTDILFPALLPIEQEDPSEIHRTMILLQFISKICSFSCMMHISLHYQTVNVEAQKDREQMKVGKFPDSLPANCNNVIGRPCSQEYKSAEYVRTHESHTHAGG
jgi:hypothetical protein